MESSRAASYTVSVLSGDFQTNLHDVVRLFQKTRATITKIKEAGGELWDSSASQAPALGQ